MSKVYNTIHNIGNSTGIAFGGGGHSHSHSNSSYSRHDRRRTSTTHGITNDGKAVLCGAGIVASAAISGSGIGAVAGRVLASAVTTGVCSDVDWSEVK